MSRNSMDEHPLLSSSQSLSDENLNEKHYSDELQERPRPRKRWNIVLLLLCASFLSNLVLLGCLYVAVNRLSNSIPWRGVKPLYSPAQDAVWHENIVFAEKTAKTKWHGPPSPEVDRAWEGLYQAGVSAVPKEQARLVANRTLPFYGDENNYMMQLEVFHVLHCLNNIRKAVFSDYYPENPLRFMDLMNDEGEIVHFDHYDHCLNSIRETLMCKADLTPDVWQWDKHLQKADVRFDMIHTCANWDSIYAWADKMTTKVEFNRTVHVLDDLHFSDD